MNAVNHVVRFKDIIAWIFRILFFTPVVGRGWTSPTRPLTQWQPNTIAWHFAKIWEIVWFTIGFKYYRLKEQRNNYNNYMNNKYFDSKRIVMFAKRFFIVTYCCTNNILHSARISIYLNSCNVFNYSRYFLLLAGWTIFVKNNPHLN